MTYSPNIEVIRRIAASNIARPRYEFDSLGRPIGEDAHDRKPYGRGTKWIGTRKGGKPCQSCERKHPFGPLCGYCWAEARKIAPWTDEAQADVLFIVEVPSDGP